MASNISPLKTRIYDHIKAIFRYVPEEANNIISNSNDDLSDLSKLNRLILSRYVLDIHLDNELNMTSC